MARFGQSVFGASLFGNYELVQRVGGLALYINTDSNQYVQVIEGPSLGVVTLDLPRPIITRETPPLAIRVTRREGSQ